MVSNGISRRELVKALALSPLMLSPLSNGYAAPLSTSATIVIVGAGMGGLAVANRLVKALNGAKIIIIDKKTEHNYQPGYTLVATGIWPKSETIEENASFIPDGVQWIKESVIEYQPDQNLLVTESGEKVHYDFLVVATGVSLRYDQIEGMDVSAIGKKGLTSIYNGPDAAQASWGALDGFKTVGGRAVLTLPHTPLKCAGAPLKMTFMVNDHLIKSGRRQNSEVTFFSAINNVFSVPAVNQDVLERWQQLNIPVHFSQRLVSIDISAKRAGFRDHNGDINHQDYDFIHVVPPMSAPLSVQNSPLASTNPSFSEGGWLAVNKDTLQHLVYPNVFGIGDVNGTPKGKTAATVKKSAPIVVENLISVIKEQLPVITFDGYTSCPLLIRKGSALLIEFDYYDRFTPTIPGIEPLTDSYLAWIMKTQLLKPAYLAVLKGRG